MCGIFGFLATEDAGLAPSTVLNITNRLFTLSESRGKEAAGIAIRTTGSLLIYKTPASASHLIRSRNYHQLCHHAFNRTDSLASAGTIGISFAIIGHSRLVTSGAQSVNDNNQPVVKDGAVAVHNGIIVNNEAIWQQLPSISRLYDVDTEVIPSLVQLFRREGKPLVKGVQDTFHTTEGAASIALLFNDMYYVVLATNTGSLYTCTSQTNGVLTFASEEYILRQLMRKRFVRRLFDQSPIHQLKPSRGFIIDLSNLRMNPFGLNGDVSVEPSAIESDARTVNIVDFSDPKDASTPQIEKKLNLGISTELVREYGRFTQAISKLQRCTKCILPETIPFIKFDYRTLLLYRGFFKSSSSLMIF